MSNLNESIENVDERLNAPAQIRMAAVVRSLPEETLSMAWRSSLNEKVLLTAKKQKRSRMFGWVWKPTAGLALASALAVVMVFHPTQPVATDTSVKSDSTIESGIVSYYQQSTVAYDVAGPGLAMPEGSQTKATATKVLDPNWTEDDLSSL